MNEEAVMLLKNERMSIKHLSPNVGFLLGNSNDVHNLDEIAPIEYECDKSLSTTICDGCSKIWTISSNLHCLTMKHQTNIGWYHC